VWVANEELAFRFPRPEFRRRTAKVELEVRVLEALPPSARAPRLELVSPRGYSALQFVRGASGEERRPPREAWPALARDVREALDAVHATPPPPGTPHVRLPSPEALLARARRDAPLAGIDPAALTEPRPERGCAEQVLCHGDLKGEHFLLDERDRLSAIVDWADACVCDPVRDLAGIVIWLGLGFARLVDPGRADRASFYARCFAVENVARTERGRWDAPRSVVYAQLRSAFADETV
jgi:aminoglycoside phosphotransferase (APT) family kinase protein